MGQVGQVGRLADWQAEQLLSRILFMVEHTHGFHRTLDLGPTCLPPRMNGEARLTASFLFVPFFVGRLQTCLLSINRFLFSSMLHQLICAASLAHLFTPLRRSRVFLCLYVRKTFFLKYFGYLHYLSNNLQLPACLIPCLLD